MISSPAPNKPVELMGKTWPAVAATISRLAASGVTGTRFAIATTALLGMCAFGQQLAIPFAEPLEA
jgi:hypothetical protein